MFEVFRNYLKTKTSFTDQQFKVICSIFTPKKIPKGTIILREEEICQNYFFVTKGCLRSYIIDENAKEHIIQFAPENWWISDQNSIMKLEPAMFFIDAIEDSEVLVADRDFNDQFSAILPNGSLVIKTLNLNSYKSMQKRVITLLSASAEDRYLEFIKTYPTIAARVPQKMIASYLGIAPESLSRIRNDLAHK
ncbi:MAG: Crp/Fnr family transcriptional regulator [Bacteroidia bacterium]|jgi:CRP-like cAMP-binding protein